MVKVNHPFQAQGDIINECREDGKPSPSVGVKYSLYGKIHSPIAGKGQNYTQTKVSRLAVQFSSNSLKDLASEDVNLSPDSDSYTTHELKNPFVFLSFRILMYNMVILQAALSIS